MSNEHGKKFIINLLIGLIFNTTGIAAIVYAFASKEAEKDWVLWTIIPVVAINTGLLFIASSVIHKVKADLIRRQRQKGSKDKLD